jgi:hypothetical protein
VQETKCDGSESDDGPDIIPGVRGDGKDERDSASDEPEHFPELRPKASTVELNEVGKVWLRKFTEITK